MTDIPLLYCVRLTKYYQRADFLIKVLNCITLTIQTNEIVAVIGTSGSGKSTLLHLLGGLDKPTEGKVFFEGHGLHQLTDNERAMIRNKRIGFVYQFHHLLSDFNVLENVAMPLLIGGLGFNQSKNKAQCVLESVGLINRIHSFPHELSGGESQRVSIARAIVNNPVLILADEPTGNLDQKNSDNIFQLLKDLNTCYGTTFIIATHDLNLAKQCHKILMISNGKIKLMQHDSFR